MQLLKSISSVVAAVALISAIFWWQSESSKEPTGSVLVQVSTLIVPPEPALNPSPAKLAPLLPDVKALSSPAQPEIGSEGYGPHIERAKDSGDAKLAWQAVKWLQSCIVNQVQEDSLRLARDSGAPHAIMTQLIQDAQAVGRRCQTVTEQHRALLPELSLLAMRGQIAGAASAFANSGKFADRSAAEHVEVLASIRRDAIDGDTLTLISSTTSGGSWGLTPIERITYLVAYIGLSDPPAAALPMAKALLDQSDLKAMEISSEQLTAAREAAQRIVLSVRSKRAPA